MRKPFKARPRNSLGSQGTLLWPNVVASWEENPAELLLDPDFIGVKAAGLCKLPQEWVPPFLILTKSFHSLCAKHQSARNTFELLTELEKDLFRQFFASAYREHGPSANVLVRSNSPTETLECRGRYRSFNSVPQIDAISKVVDSVLTQSSETMCAILQMGVEPGVVGHMSNERRISPVKTRWLVEGLIQNAEKSQQFIKSSKLQPRMLLALTQSDVLECLRAVAGFFNTQPGGYFHCEWVWNGKRLWVVQADDAAPVLLNDDANRFLTTVVPQSPHFEPKSSALVHFSAAEDRWKKLQRPLLFKKLKIPTADVFLLTGAEASKAIAFRDERLIEDLELMCRHPIVVRCDIANTVARPDVFLPTSPAISDVEHLIQYLEKTTISFRNQGLAESDWAFLLAHLVLSKASAMVHARPHGGRVQIDALWGYPDGLNHLAHDTWFFYSSDRRVKEHRRFKGQCLLPVNDSWVTCNLNPPLDWQSVLSKEEARVLADWALQVAEALGQEVQLMALTRVGGLSGRAGCLPWHYTTWQVPSYAESSDFLPSQVHAITSRGDMQALERRAPDGKCRGFLLQPSGELLRNDEFIEEVAHFAAARKKPLYFQGSLLGHAYYLMARTGASVIPIAQEEPSGDKKTYFKLVRDRIPVVIREAGALARVRNLPKSEAIRLLAQKLIEESFEVWTAPKEGLIEELADVLEVVDALRSNANVTSDALAQVQAKKRGKRGGFDELIFLEETDMQSFKMYDSEPGHLPLFTEQAVSEGSTRIRVPQLIRVERSSDAADLLRFSVPLIPPVEQPASRKAFVANVGEHQIEVQYIGNRLIAAVRQRMPIESPDQLTLFPEFENIATANENV